MLNDNITAGGKKIPPPFAIDIKIRTYIRTSEVFILVEKELS